MTVNARTEEFQQLELFGKYALFTNGRIDRPTVPKGWYCNDFRGSDDDPGELCYIEESVAVNHAGSILMPEKALDDAIQGNSRYLLLIALVLLAVSLLLSIFISRRYLRPVTEALDRIKARDYAGPGKTPYLEINDLMEFLTQQDEELKKRSLAIAPPPDETAPMFEQFLQNVKTLSQAERNVFDLYIRGYKAQEIADELHLSINTIKTHNRRIFAKLNVSTRKELLVYIDMMKELNMIHEE